MRALSFAIGWGVLAALVMAAGGLFLRREFAASRDEAARASARVEADWLAQLVAQRVTVELSLLAEQCSRDVQVERFSLELSAGGGDAESADRIAAGLAPANQAVLVGKLGHGRVTLLGKSREAPSFVPTSSALDTARTRYVLARDRDDRDWLLLSCRRTGDGSGIWLASAQRADNWLVEQAGKEAGEQARLVRGTPTAGESVAYTFASDAGETLSLTVPARLQSDLSVDLALVLAVLCAFLAAAGAGFVIGRRAEQHERALAAIENAAERVAQGDLVSTINLRLGDRADHTFHTFDRMTKELRDMRVKLAESEREAAFREVARRIAHEIKNPLLPIQISIETLRKARDKQRADFGEIFEESTRAILDEVKRLERIVREFGEFARLPKPRPGALDLAELVRDTVSLYVPEDVELSLALADGVPKVRADREQITQVLVNLVKNALEAAQGRSPVRLNIQLANQGHGAVLSIADNGPGIEKEARERVFEPYFTTKQEGTGLGLAIVKRIMAEHQGSIEVVDSALGGACLRLTLPAYEAAQSVAIHSTSRP